jgi:hypothetical protein
VSNIWSRFNCSLDESRSFTKLSLFDDDSSTTQLPALLIFQESVCHKAKSLGLRCFTRLQLLCRIRWRYSRSLRHTTVVNPTLRRTSGLTGRRTGLGVVHAKRLLGHGPRSSTTEVQQKQSQVKVGVSSVDYHICARI